MINEVNADNGILYKETIKSNSRISGETLRWETNREFLLENYEFEELNVSGEIIKVAKINLLSNTQNGQYEEIIQPLKAANFELLALLHSDGTVSEFRWEMFLFRDINDPAISYDPFDNDIRSNFTKFAGHKRFDLDSNLNFLSVNLEYFEYHSIDGKLKRLRVNTELSTNNADDGRILKSAIHIVKRDGDEILSVYDWNIQEVNTFYRYFNYLDQPYLLVPYQIGAVLLIIFVYLIIHSYWKKNNFRIVRIDPDKEEEYIDEKNIPNSDS